MTNGLAFLPHRSVRQKLIRVSSVPFSYVAVYALLQKAAADSEIAAVVRTAI